MHSGPDRPQRTTTDNAEPTSTCAAPHLCRSRWGPIWLWEQGVDIPTQLSNYRKLRNSEHNDNRSPRTTEVMQMQRQRRPSLPDWLYLAIVAALGLYFVIGAIAWTTFIYNGIPVPDSFATILATIAGGLVGVLAPTGGPTRPSPPSQEQRPPAE
jgi:hypothetical protein